LDVAKQVGNVLELPTLPEQENWIDLFKTIPAGNIVTTITRIDNLYGHTCLIAESYKLKDGEPDYSKLPWLYCYVLINNPNFMNKDKTRCIINPVLSEKLGYHGLGFRWNRTIKLWQRAYNRGYNGHDDYQLSIEKIMSI
jgi:hypothetical protein